VCLRSSAYNDFTLYFSYFFDYLSVTAMIIPSRFQWFTRKITALMLLCVALSVSAWAQDNIAADLQAARQAVRQADLADADQYAPDSIRQARHYLEQAQAAATEQRRGRQAETNALIQRAKVSAELALAQSEEAKTRAQLTQMRAEVERLQQQITAIQEH